MCFPWGNDRKAKKRGGRVVLSEIDFEGYDQRFQFSFRKRESLKEKREFFFFFFWQIFFWGGGGKRVFFF